MNTVAHELYFNEAATVGGLIVTSQAKVTIPVQNFMTKRLGKTKRTIPATLSIAKTLPKSHQAPATEVYDRDHRHKSPNLPNQGGARK